MKRIILILVLLLTLSFSVFAEEYDLRNINWGMTPEQVKTAETAADLFKELPGSLYYFDNVAGHEETIIHYYFSEDNELIMADFSFTTKYAEDENSKYIRDYKEFKDLLIKKYGEPILDKAIWKDERNKNFMKESGIFLRLGKFKYRTEWQTKKTAITMQMSSTDSYEIYHLLSYSSVKYFDELENKKNKEDNNKTEEEKLNDL